MIENQTIYRIGRLFVLTGLVLALAIAFPDTTQATSFNEVKKLIASDPQVSGQFGNSVAVNGDTSLVGADRHDDLAGAAYVFQRDRAARATGAK